MANTNDLAKYITSTTDFYTLLGLPSSTFTESELRRAYRKTSLKYHPDKLGSAFDPAKYELFQAAYGVLENEELKAKYDAHRQARLQRERANELFEGKRRAMKEDLEMRERGERKRTREEEEGDREMERLQEEGRKRRAERERMMGGKAESPAPKAPEKKAEESVKAAETTSTSKAAEPEQKEEEDEVAILERRIREAEAAKAKRKAEKKARKSGIFTPSSATPSVTHSRPATNGETQEFSTPIKKPRPDIFKGLKAADANASSASPRFSFSPSVATPKRKDFTATMERLKAAEKARLEQEIRRQEEEETAAV
jgi:DnaJ family protein C protein 17